LRQSIHEGVRAVRRDPVLMRAVSGYALLLFVAPSMQILLPVLVDRVLHQGATLLGFFLAAFGVGAIGGALLVPWLTGLFGAETLYLSCFAVCAAALAIVGSTRRIAIYFIMLLLLGASQNAISTLTITLMQSRVAKEMRGRVMSLQTLLLMGVRPLGDFPLSLLLAAIGTSLTAGISAALIGSYGLFLAGTRYRNPSVTSQPRAAKLR
jgi:MFS family permease